MVIDRWLVDVHHMPVVIGWLNVSMISVYWMYYFYSGQVSVAEGRNDEGYH
jgi:hypothetical protein